LLRRGSAYLSATAAATATLFALDAWFDVLTAAAGDDTLQAYAAALLGEVPIAIVLAAIAAWAVRRGGDPARSAR